MALLTFEEACDILNDMHLKGMFEVTEAFDEELLYELREDYLWQE